MGAHSSLEIRRLPNPCQAPACHRNFWFEIDLSGVDRKAKDKSASFSETG